MEEREERRAVYPGTFDPITNGHLDIIKRAAQLFDHVDVLVSINANKNPVFLGYERQQMIERAIEGLENVSVLIWDGLLADYVRKYEICAIVKGLRAVSDFEYEFQQALANKILYGGAETIFIPTSAENMYLSSSVVKQIASLDGSIAHFVPECILDTVKLKYMELRRCNLK